MKSIIILLICICTLPAFSQDTIITHGTNGAVPIYDNDISGQAYLAAQSTHAPVKEEGINYAVIGSYVFSGCILLAVGYIIGRGRKSR